jgi:hypothetical protein
LPVELETEDPLKALSSRSIHDRCAAARDLSKIGTPEHIPPLVVKAAGDKSPAVRLVTAGAIADILSRFRRAPRRTDLDDDARAALLRSFSVVDPGRNAGLFPMLACLDTPAVFARIATGLRDPRAGVRVGAAVGLLRMCTSDVHLGDAELEARVVSLFSDTRLRPDALAEIARVCGACGYTTAIPVMERMDIGGAHGEFVDEVVQILARADDPVTGLWVSDGRDAGEIDPEPGAGPATLVINDGIATVHTPGGGFAAPASLDRDGIRRMHFRRVGAAEPGAGMQALGRTWHPADEEAVGALVGAAVDVESMDWAAPAAAEGSGDVADALLPHLGDTAAEDRGAALLLQAAGRTTEALARLEEACGKKRCPPDTWFFLGEARAAAGDAEGAAVAWAATLKKTRKKSLWHVAVARERVD